MHIMAMIKFASEKLLVEEEQDYKNADETKPL